MSRAIAADGFPLSSRCSASANGFAEAADTPAPISAWTISLALPTSSAAAGESPRPAASRARTANDTAFSVRSPPGDGFARVVSPQPYGNCGSYTASPTLTGSCSTDFGHVTGSRPVNGRVP